MKKAAGMIILYLLCCFLFSCGKNSVAGTPQLDTVSKNFSEVFDKFWDGMNKNYIFWGVDTTDWNMVYTRYKPLFSKLYIDNAIDRQTSINYFKAITLGLKDGHFQIIFDPPSNSDIYPAFIRKQSKPDFRPPFDYSDIDTSYFDPGYITGFDSTTHPDATPLRVRFATINNKVIYFSCNGFSLRDAYRTTGNGVTPVLDSFFTALNRNTTTISKLILDVRNNFGGDLTDLNFLVGHFIENPLQFGYTRYKSGTGRLDYTPWIKAFITPQPNAAAIKCPIVVLADRYSVSLAELVAMAIKALPNGTIIGEPTWGATGPLVANEVYNDGQFSIPGFMTVYMSSAEFKYIDNRSYEDVGFPPDISVPFDVQAVASGKDPQLEKAIRFSR